MYAPILSEATKTLEWKQVIVKPWSKSESKPLS